MRLLFTWIIFLFLGTAGMAQTITIQLTSPSKNARFEACSDIQLAAEVSIESGTLRRVEFHVNGDRLLASTREPYEVVWETVPDGIYEIQAIAVDTDNARTATEPIFIYVGNVQPGNQIINGEFNCSLDPWFLDTYVNAQATATIFPDLWLTDDSSGVLVEITNQGDAFWAVQLMQPFKVDSGHTYQVWFTAQADQEKEISVDISKNYDDFAPLHSFEVTVYDLNTYGPFSFEAAADDDNLMFKFVLGGNLIPIEIDAVNVIDEQWTSVEQQNERITTFELHQNYPNPFNPQTTITYSLDSAGPVTLSIYNILGQPIQTVSGTQSDGHHTFVWDGKTDAGIDAPSGLYFYRLETQQGILTRKMHLLR